MRQPTWAYSEAVEKQAETVGYFRSSDGVSWLNDMIDRNMKDLEIVAAADKMTMVEAERDRKAMKALIRAIPQIIAEASTYYVTADILQMLMQALTTMPPWTLYPEYVPAKCGYIYFQKPLMMKTGSISGIEELQIRALSWDDISAYSNKPCLYTLVYCEVIDAPVPVPFLPMTWPVGMTPDDAVKATLLNELDPVTRQAQGDDTVQSADILSYELCQIQLNLMAALFAFMHQTIMITTEERAGRGTRKRIEGKNLLVNPDPPIRVVKLRRTAQRAGAESSPDAPDWQYQWMVSGHWRNQFYPSRNIHQPVWIDSYVKGPEDKPMKAPRPTLFLVAR